MGNVVNKGYITNLPDGCCVEVPTFADDRGLHPMFVGAGTLWFRRPAAAVASRVAGLRQITSSAAANRWPSFSPDGSQVAFSSDRTGHFELYIRSLAGGDLERRVTFDGADNAEPAWNPNGSGTRVCVQDSRRDSGDPGLWRNGSVCD
jgi:tricorn protease-like protein